MEYESDSVGDGREVGVVETDGGSKKKKAATIKNLAHSPNCMEFLDKEACDNIAAEVLEGYRLDKDSLKEWEERTADAMKLALQLREPKSFPWDGASNVKFPLVTIAALQFLARISIMTKSKKLVKMDYIGGDQNGQKFQRAKRVSAHMNYQLWHQIQNWHDADEQTKFSAAIVGMGVKKTYFDPIKGVVVSEHVPISRYIVNYFAKDFDSRETHLIPMAGRTVQELVRLGLYDKESAENLSDASGEKLDNLIDTALNEIKGQVVPTASVQANSSGTTDEGPTVADSVHYTIEQHCWIDLDKDGCAEPYVVTVDLKSGSLLRIVARYNDDGSDVIRRFDRDIDKLEVKIIKAKMEQNPDQQEIQAMEDLKASIQASPENTVVRVLPTSYFTRYIFIPSPDGGSYGLGLSALLGPQNESVDTLINQIIDSGTMLTTAGGFIARGFKGKGGAYQFSPFEWKPIDSTGDDLRKSIFPLPVREPSQVLLHTLQLLITYAERISGATDIMSGVTPGQNTPAETARHTVEQGMVLFSGIYARMYRGFASELNKIYKLNQLHLSDFSDYRFITQGEDQMILDTDYDSHMIVVPNASPEATSTAQQKEKAGFLLQLSGSRPGFNVYEATNMALDAWEIPNTDVIYPNPKGQNAIPPQPNPQIELEKAKLDLQKQQFQHTMQVTMIKLQADEKLMEAKVTELQAKAMKELSEAKGVEIKQELEAINSQINLAKMHREHLMKVMDQLHSQGMDVAQHQQAQHEHNARMGLEMAKASMAQRQSQQGQPQQNTGTAAE